MIKKGFALAFIIAFLFTLIYGALFSPGPRAQAATVLATPTLVAPPHNTWLNYNPTFTSTVSGAGGGNVGLHTSIAIGTDGNPVISYIDQTNGKLKVAKCGNPSCSSGNTITTIADAANSDTSIAIGKEVPNGFPVISYQGSGSDLRVAKCTNAACTASSTTQVACCDAMGFGENVGQYNSIVTGTDGFPVISYTNWDGNMGVPNRFKMRVAKCTNAACTAKTITELDSQSTIAFVYTSIALGREGTGLPVITYNEDLSGDVRFVKCSNASCTAFTKRVLTSSVGRHWYEDIAVGTDNFPVLSHDTETATQVLTSDKCNDASCSANVTNQVDGNGASHMGFWSSIAIGTDTFPVVSYRNNTGTSLKVAKCINISCSGGSTRTGVDPGSGTRDPGFYTSITIGTDTFPVISYAEANTTTGRYSLKVAKCINVSCTGSSTINYVDAGSSAGNVWAYFHWAQVGSDPAPPADQNGSTVANGGPGNSTFTFTAVTTPTELPDGIYDWQAKAMNASDDSSFTSFWRVKKDTLAPSATCSVGSVGTNVTVNYSSSDPVPASGGTPSGVVGGTLQGSINGGAWSTVQQNISGTYTETGVIGETRSYRFQVSDNAGNYSGGSPGVAGVTYTACGSTTLRNPAWIKTTVGEVGSIGEIKATISGAQANADYLVISNGLITNFTSAKNWLVPSYSSGLNSSVLSFSFADLWTKFGQGKASDWLSPGPPDNNGVIPGAKGVYAYPSILAAGSANPADERDFTFTAAVGSIPAGTNPVVLFVNGNLNINADLNLGNKRVIFIVKDSVKIDPCARQTDGIFLVFGTFDTGSGACSLLNFPYLLFGSGGGAPAAGNRIKIAGNSTVNGNVYSNASVECGGDNSHQCNINGGNVYSVGDFYSSSYPYFNFTPPANKVYSPTNPPAPVAQPYPISDTAAFESYWEAQANISNDAVGNTTISANQSLGPKQINGTLTVNTGVTLTVTGPIYVTGTLTIQSGAKVQIDSSNCPSGTVILADSMSINAGATVSASSTTPKKYLLLYSINGAGDLTIQNASGATAPTQVEAIVYAKGRVMIPPAVDAAHATVITGAVVGGAGSHVGGIDPIYSSGQGYVTYNYGQNAAAANFATCQGSPPSASQISTYALTINGGAVAMGGFNLGRDLGASNSTTAAEIFNFYPAYLYLFAAVDPVSKKSLLGKDNTLYLEATP